MVTKRQLGIGIVVASLIVVLGLFAVDVLEAGQWGGFGPLQWIGFALCITGLVVGLLLIRLGDRPA
jgi:hypothetical protein